jgi:hypothetical protein
VGGAAATGSGSASGTPGSLLGRLWTACSTVRIFSVAAAPGQDSPSAGAVLGWVVRRAWPRLPVPAVRDTTGRPALPTPPADEGAAVADGAVP